MQKLKFQTEVDQEMIGINYLQIPIYMHFLVKLQQRTFYLFDKCQHELAYPCVYLYHISFF